jgi:CheY-like chemotaxis protein
MHTVLIVEDEGILRKALKSKFEGNGYAVVEAKDGMEALEVLTTAKTPVDIILLDVVMPRMDGITFLREWTRKNTGPAIPIIILSNLTDGDKIQHSLESGVYDYLVKADWSLGDVLEKVRARLAK